MTQRRKPAKRKKPLFSHHKHSGKHMPHHHTHFLVLLLLVIFSGFLCMGITRSAKAEDITVRAKVAAPLPPSPAEITSPLDGAEFSAIPIDVSGTCPAGYLIKLFRNDVFSGSTICTPDGNFGLQSDLFFGSNSLVARVYNSTDDEGPVMPAVTVRYAPPTPTASNPTDPVGPAGSVAEPPTVQLPQFLLLTDYTHQGHIIGEKISWTISAAGGRAPYAVHVDWGDGKTNLYSRKQPGEFIIEHTYNTSGHYTVRISGSDDAGQSAFLQLIVISNAGLNSIVSTSGTFSSPLGELSLQTIAWSAYVLVLATVASFWLGESWKLRELASKLKAHRRIVHKS